MGNSDSISLPSYDGEYTDIRKTSVAVFISVLPLDGLTGRYQFG